MQNNIAGTADDGELLQGVFELLARPSVNIRGLGNLLRKFGAGVRPNAGKHNLGNFRFRLCVVPQRSSYCIFGLGEHIDEFAKCFVVRAQAILTIFRQGGWNFVTHELDKAGARWGVNGRRIYRIGHDSILIAIYVARQCSTRHGRAPHTNAIRTIP